ncbi:MAG: hypothetical protein PHI41_09580 [Erysipelotrichaceae bacterium]|nr:hypothetical protein [Erysipelotrichaceae bacterium]
MRFFLQRKHGIRIKKVFTPNHDNDIWDDVPGVEYGEDIEGLFNDRQIKAISILLRKIAKDCQLS